ncbi:hypothetical protein [Bartonella sp. AD328YNZD]|uniref:hypothetical protein n=1 Tax=Bartonella sp. AD328YNZD TaxID=3243464 RepID=UPI0035D12C62
MGRAHSVLTSAVIKTIAALMAFNIALRVLCFTMTGTHLGLFLVLIPLPSPNGKISLLLLLISLKLGKSSNKDFPLLFKALKVCGRALNEAFPTFGNG